MVYYSYLSCLVSFPFLRVFGALGSCGKIRSQYQPKRATRRRRNQQSAPRGSCRFVRDTACSGMCVSALYRSTELSAQKRFRRLGFNPSANPPPPAGHHLRRQPIVCRALRRQPQRRPAHRSTALHGQLCPVHLKQPMLREMLDDNLSASPINAAHRGFGI